MISLKKLSTIAFIVFSMYLFCFSFNAIAFSFPKNSDENATNEEDILNEKLEKDLNYDEEEKAYQDWGSFTFKTRIFGILSRGKLSSFSSKPSASDTRKILPLLKSGYGLETAVVKNFTPNFATEISFGFQSLQIKNLALANISHNYEGGNVSSKRKSLYLLPLNITMQYHIAPYGAIRPYIGGGYCGSYVFTKNNSFKMNNIHGPVLQAGFDIVSKDDTLINLDIKQHLFFPTKIKYASSLTKEGAPRLSSKIKKLTPFIFSLGVGFKM